MPHQNLTDEETVIIPKIWLEESKSFAGLPENITLILFSNNLCRICNEGTNHKISLKIAGKFQIKLCE